MWNPSGSNNTARVLSVLPRRHVSQGERPAKSSRSFGDLAEDQEPDLHADGRAGGIVCTRRALMMAAAGHEDTGKYFGRAVEDKIALHGK